jgi:hypothetical protein
LIFVRLIGWLMLLARSEASKDWKSWFYATTMLALLADSRLTGMSKPELDQFAARLAPAQAEQRLYTERGGLRRKAMGPTADHCSPAPTGS